MRLRFLSGALVVLLIAGLFSGCSQSGQLTAEDTTGADATMTDAAEEPVVLTLAGPWPDCPAVEAAATAFTAQNPNCTIVYEYLQDFDASIEKRMSGEEPVDLFLSNNIQSDSALLPYALDLNSCEALDLSNTYEGLIDNFTFRDDSGTEAKLYCVPLGAEMRGMYVNTTLLSSLGLDVPSDQASLLAACEVLKENGFIPFHGNPGIFSQRLLYPWICNLIANADDPASTYDLVNAHEPGLSELFREPLEFLYSLVENDYYDYNTAQTELNLFTDASDEACARDFLSIAAVDGTDTYEKTDDIGQVAFMPSAMSIQSVMDKIKEDYHSQIEYVFIPAPVGADGGYVYLSPARGIAVNKNSENVDWAVRFLNFLFQPENNEAFAEAFNIISNTKDAYSYVKSLYHVPENHISELGQVTFDYDFYAVITNATLIISKANNPKYMQDDGSGNLSLYSLDYYIDELETSFATQ